MAHDEGDIRLFLELLQHLSQCGPRFFNLAPGEFFPKSWRPDRHVKGGRAGASEGCKSLPDPEAQSDAVLDNDAPARVLSKKLREWAVNGLAA